MADLTEAGFALQNGGTRLRGTVQAVHLHRLGAEPGFAPLTEARSAFAANAPPLGDLAPLYLDEVVIGAAIRNAPGAAVCAVR